ncbi:DUF2637 domain-containing protein [Streptomyces sp. adm13(2018)]|uniref:DUF2637 domain-containing protein n=1 Tax=Streptomyces sp. adm13(2018) TaxID=2479007 RepID=UPI0011CE9223|nr:DUF2637 domain-containing protein [Streptomyces sp. adm13(2018)]TXS08098.1 DUF2637 domain-containing protein [Streptomyces sp. adm13(2018)]
MKTTPSQALAAAAGLVIITLTGAAFWLSYAHLAEVALAHGLGQATERAWAWPATLDLFIVAGELLMLRAALRRQVDGWAIALTAVGSVGSIVLNVAGVTGDRDPGNVPLLDYVVAAVPPTAALLAFGALMRQIHQALAERGEPFKLDNIPLEQAPDVPAEPAPARGLPEVMPAGVRLLPLTARPEPVAAEAEPSPAAVVPVPAVEPLPKVPALPVLGPWMPVAELLAAPTGTASDLHASGRPEAPKDHPEPAGSIPVPPVPPADSGAADIESEDTSNTTFNRQVADARNWLAAEPELTGTAIGQRLGKSDTYGRRVRRAALAEHREAITLRAAAK